MPKHSNASLPSRHAVHFKEYVNQAEREAAHGFNEMDLYKIALQLDDKTLWVLSSIDPTTWTSSTITSDERLTWNEYQGQIDGKSASIHGHLAEAITESAEKRFMSQADKTKLDTLTDVRVFSYDNRAMLRTLTPVTEETAIVGDLGMFTFYAGDLSPDDDETCFATPNGRFLLEMVSLDKTDKIVNPEPPKNILLGWVQNTYTSISINSFVFLYATVLGADISDSVIINPPYPNGWVTGIDVTGMVIDTNVIKIQIRHNSNASGSGTYWYERAVSLTAQPWQLTIVKGDYI